MSTLLTRKDLIVKIHDSILENLIRNEVDVIYYKSEDKYVNTADAKKQARESRDRAIDNVRGHKRTLEILESFLEAEE